MHNSKSYKNFLLMERKANATGGKPGESQLPSGGACGERNFSRMSTDAFGPRIRRDKQGVFINVSCLCVPDKRGPFSLWGDLGLVKGWLHATVLNRSPQAVAPLLRDLVSQLRHPAQREQIPLRAETGDHPIRAGGDERMVPKFFALMHVGDMNLDHRVVERV